MSKEFNLAAASRDAKKEKASKLRAEDYIPAVVYGPNAENRVLKVKRADFSKVYSEAGETALVNLSIDNGAPKKVLIYDVSRNPQKGRIENVDFLQVNMKEKITVEIPLVFVGELAPELKEKGGILNKTADKIEVECLPSDLIDSFEIDISSLKEIGDSIKMTDIKLPKGLELTSLTDETLVSVTAQEVEEEPVPAEEVAEGEEKPAEEGEAAPQEEEK